MKPDRDRRLEKAIDARLKELGELTAPATLAHRVMRAIEQRSSVPWYGQSWDTWPFALRAVSFVGLCVAFAGLCLGAWELVHSGAGQGTIGSFDRWFADAGAIWRTLGVLAKTVGLLVEELGTGVIAVGIALIFTAWVVCIGLGTVYVRLAMRLAARRIQS